MDESPPTDLEENALCRHGNGDIVGVSRLRARGIGWMRRFSRAALEMTGIGSDLGPNVPGLMGSHNRIHVLCVLFFLDNTVAVMLV